ncbi:hypothetical protein QBC37DRAFT_417218 [Rhypophila decipiens]|uniref:Uncharacterized protein n=1 Tax=Rhypophila decipiens TaxID=261697 RepID=A0AAN7BAN1_9PEZI|nr:hypothetical protein QBC37DRAFT_417218 [Rhypophila decipiens]
MVMLRLDSTMSVVCMILCLVLVYDAPCCYSFFPAFLMCFTANCQMARKGGKLSRTGKVTILGFSYVNLLVLNASCLTPPPAAVV